MSKMRLQDQYTSPSERMKRANREAKKEILALMGWIVLIPVIILLIGLIAAHGNMNHW